MIAIAVVLGYLFGAMSVIVSFWFYPKLKQEETQVEETVPDEREEKLKAQWDELLNYDGNIRE